MTISIKQLERQPNDAENMLRYVADGGSQCDVQKTIDKIHPRTDRVSVAKAKGASGWRVLVWVKAD